MSSTMFSEKLPSKHYTEAELEAMYMGTEYETRKRFQRNNSFNQRRQSFNGRQRSLFEVHSLVDMLRDQYLIDIDLEKEEFHHSVINRELL